MSSPPIDKAAVRRLVTDVVDSFEKLEIVVHMHRRAFLPTTAAEIAAALSLVADEVAKCMAALDHHRALEANGPWATELDSLVRMYDEDRIEVLNMMTRSALDRVRSGAARLFADAFVLRPKKKGDPDA